MSGHGLEGSHYTGEEKGIHSGAKPVIFILLRNLRQSILASGLQISHL